MQQAKVNMEGTPEWSKLGEAWRKIQYFLAGNVATSSLTALDCDVEVRKINNSVYELYRPQQGECNVEILFFHGLQLGQERGAHINTWMTRSEPPELWPKTWLTKSFPRARILSISYDSSGTRGSENGRSDLHAISENLFLDVIILARVGQRWGCPVVLVGHCLGGLLIKQMCVHVSRKEFNLASTRESAENFVENLRGVFLFATPQQGMNFSGNPTDWQNPSPLLKGLKVLNASTGRLNEVFQHYRTKNKWELQGVGETHETTTANTKSMFHAVMVSEASARLYMDKFHPVSADHFNICKPVDRTNSSFQALVAFVKGLTGKDVHKKRHWFKSPKYGGVGLEERAKEVRDRLQQEERLAIVGMGGIGKTTLAKCVFNTIASTFEYTCFVENVKEELKRVPSLEIVVMNNLHRSGRKMTQTEGAWLQMEGKRVLLVLDDVDRKEQIDAVPDSGWFAKESRIIATSRNKSEEIFQGHFFLYNAYLLNDRESRKLLCSYAFKYQEMPEELVKAVVNKCKGLPLTLEVIGCYLGSETSIAIWKDALVKLSKAEAINGSAEDRLWSKLRVSFDTLGSTEQEMFLDCATLFADYYYDITDIKAAWERSWGESEVPWKNLVDRCLVSVSDEYTPMLNHMKRVKMHQQLRDMGRGIACPQRPNIHASVTRVWERERALHMLTNADHGSRILIKGLKLGDRGKQTPVTEVCWNTLANMSELRCLRVRDVSLVGNGPAFPSSLTFLSMTNSWREGVPSFFVFGIRQRWIFHDTDLANLSNLTVLRIFDVNSEARLPTGFGKLKNLQALYLYMEELEVLPDSFGQLASLQRLLVRCPKLKELPDSFGKLALLQRLTLRSCSTLCMLPDSFRGLNSLQELSIVQCRRLRTLRESIFSVGPGLPALREVRLARTLKRRSDNEVSEMVEVLDLASKQLEGFGWVSSGDTNKNLLGTLFLIRSFLRPSVHHEGELKTCSSLGRAENMWPNPTPSLGRVDSLGPSSVSSSFGRTGAVSTWPSPTSSFGRSDSIGPSSVPSFGRASDYTGGSASSGSSSNTCLARADSLSPTDSTGPSSVP